MISYVAGADPDNVCNECARSLPERAEVNTATSPSLAEITAKELRLSTCAQWLCRRMSIGRDEVLAIGDAPNDLPMLLWSRPRSRHG